MEPFLREGRKGSITFMYWNGFPARQQCGACTGRLPGAAGSFEQNRDGERPRTARRSTAGAGGALEPRGGRWATLEGAAPEGPFLGAPSAPAWLGESSSGPPLWRVWRGGTGSLGHRVLSLLHQVCTELFLWPGRWASRSGQPLRPPGLQVQSPSSAQASLPSRDWGDGEPLLARSSPSLFLPGEDAVPASRPDCGPPLQGGSAHTEPGTVCGSRSWKGLLTSLHHDITLAPGSTEVVNTQGESALC